MDKFFGFLFTGLKLLHSFCLPVSLFVASLDSAGLSLVTCEFLLISGVNFETSGLVFIQGQLLIHRVGIQSSSLYKVKWYFSCCISGIFVHFCLNNDNIHYEKLLILIIKIQTLKTPLHIFIQSQLFLDKGGIQSWLLYEVKWLLIDMSNYSTSDSLFKICYLPTLSNAEHKETELHRLWRWSKH